MPKPRKGKKSVPWNKDPQILQRLAKVEDLDLAGYRVSEIARQLKLSETTIRRDIQRIGILWHERSSADILAMRERSIANFRRLQRLAHEDYGKAPPDQQTLRPTCLRVQLDAEKEIVKLQGTQTPVEQKINITNAQQAIDALSTSELLKRAAALEELARKLLSGEGDDAEDETQQDR